LFNVFFNWYGGFCCKLTNLFIFLQVYCNLMMIFLLEIIGFWSNCSFFHVVYAAFICCLVGLSIAIPFFIIPVVSVALWFCFFLRLFLYINALFFFYYYYLRFLVLGLARLLGWLSIFTCLCIAFSSLCKMFFLLFLFCLVALWALMLI